MTYQIDILVRMYKTRGKHIKCELEKRFDTIFFTAMEL